MPACEQGSAKHTRRPGPIMDLGQRRHRVSWIGEILRHVLHEIMNKWHHAHPSQHVPKPKHYNPRKFFNIYRRYPRFFKQ